MSTAGKPRILVAVDPRKRPEDPLALGIRLARLTGAPLELASVFALAPLQPDDDELREIRAGAERDLLSAVEGVEGITVAGARVLGAPSTARALQALSEDPEVGAVVIGSTTRGPLRRTLPGSIADRLLGGAAAAIGFAPHGYALVPEPQEPVIGVAFDGSQESGAALAGARRLARASGARLRVVTVHQRFAFGGATLAAAPVETVNQKLERELRELLEQAVDGARDELGDRVEGEFACGRPVDTLVEQSRELDLLLAGSRGYGPLGAVLLGSTTHDVARLAHCPLLITPRGHELAIV